MEVGGTKLPNGDQLRITTERKNPAATGAVTGSATYASFASSVLGTNSVLDVSTSVGFRYCEYEKDLLQLSVWDWSNLFRVHKAHYVCKGT